MQKVGNVDVYNHAGAIIKFRVAWKVNGEEKYSDWTGDFSKGDFGHIDLTKYAIPEGATIYPQIDAKGSVTGYQEPTSADYAAYTNCENVASYGVSGTVNKLDIPLFK